MNAPLRVYLSMLLCCVTSSTPYDVSAWTASAHSWRHGGAFQNVGHDIVVDPALRRFTAKVVVVGKPEDDGKIYSFKVEPIGPGMGLPLAKELKGWRLTLLSGERFLSVFEVADNNASDIVIAKNKGGVNGLASGDVLIIEDIPLQTDQPAT